MTVNPLEKKEALQELCRQYGISYLGLFGSYARGEATPASDIDLLIRFKSKGGRSLFDLLDIDYEFEDKLGKKVDLVDERLLKDWIKPYVYADLKPVYEEQ